MRAVQAPALAAAVSIAMVAPAFAETRNFNLPPFHAVDIATGITAEISVGSPQSVSAESSVPFDKLELDVENGKFVARLDSNVFDFIMEGGLLGLLINGRPDVTLHITVPTLDEVMASSGADISATGISGDVLRASASSGADIDLRDVATGRFDAEVSSGASFEAKGTCETLDANVSSGGTLDLGDLVCKRVIANASSGGDLDVHALEAVRANASSGGNINIAGNPPGTDFEATSGGDIDLDD